MIPFVLVSGPEARVERDAIAGACLSRFVRELGVQPSRYDAGCVTILASDPRGMNASPVVRVGSLVGVGEVRLDNRDEVLSWAGSAQHDRSDLAAALAVLAARGTAYIPRLLGDFAFVAMHVETRRVIAARDAFGVRTLFYAHRGGSLTVSSRATMLGDSEEYDPEFLGEFLINGYSAPERSVFKDVSAVPAGHVLMAAPHQPPRVTRFWSAERFVSGVSPKRDEVVETFRQLFRTAVGARIALGGVTWSQLSGGLDSSSVVSMACSLTDHEAPTDRIAGTVTLVDRLGTGDERQFVDAVTERWKVPNERVIDSWLWERDGSPPPRIDQPELSLPLYARDRRMVDIVRSGGGRVLLSGVGADHYLTGTLQFLADWLWTRRAGEAVRTAARWATVGRTSFWTFSWENGVLPLLPTWARAGFRREGERLPEWIQPAFARRYDLKGRQQWRVLSDAPRGRKYASTLCLEMDYVWACVDRGVVDDSLEVRYPFLYRPLVEFCLGLPVDLVARPFARKWILREAMRGLVPELVRTRRSKGGLAGRVEWSFQRERPTLDALISAPVLADLGCVDPQRLRDGLNAACTGNDWARSQITNALSLETWLSLRRGRWPPVAASPTRAALSARE